MTATARGFRLSQQQLRSFRSADTTVVECVVTLRGPVDEGRLRTSVRDAVARHEALRTVLRRAEAHEAVQVVLAVDQAFAWGAGDLDPDHGPVMRGRLDADSGELRLLTLARNADPHSVRVLFDDLIRSYRGDPEPMPPPVQYAQYAQWQLDQVDQVPAAQAAPSGGTSVRLPYDLAERGEDGCDDHPVDIPAPVAGALARMPGDELESLLIAAWCGLLARLGDEREVTVAVLGDGRGHPDLADAVGPYAEPLPVRVTVMPGTSATDLRAEVTRVLAAARDGQDSADQPQDPATPVVALLDHPRERTAAGVTFRLSGQTVPTGNAELALLAVRADDAIRLRVRCRTGSFWPDTGPTLADQLAASLEGRVVRPDDAVLDTDLLTPRARALLNAGNDPADLDDPPSFLELLGRWIVRNPHGTAITDSAGALTYAQLDDQADRLAARLRDGGVTRGSLAALCLAPGRDVAIAIVAVARAGAAWLPIDPQWPVARFRRIVRDSQCDALIAHGHLLPSGGTGGVRTVVRLGDEELPERPSRQTVADPSPDDLAYVTYTSGSTGAPKGVSVTHRGLGNYLAWSCDAYRLSTRTVSLVHSPLSFDLTLTSLLSPLAAGGTVRFTSAPGVEGLIRDVTTSRDLTLLKLTPAHLHMLRTAVPPENLGSLDALVVGGEALTEERIGPWRSLAPNATTINEYGPTETVVGCCAARHPAPAVRETVPIGRPVRATRLYLLDPAGRRVGIGVTGEIYVGGAGVARGYHRQPALTAERFVPDPFRPGGRLYRTGDLARFLPTGDIEYVGRNDDQVQIGGHRVELGEVESVLARHPDVQASAAAVRSDPPMLYGYVVAAPGPLPRPAELRSFVADRLPAALVPAAVTVVPELPMTANGKLDRDRLPAPVPDPAQAARQTATTEDRQAPGGELEERIRAIWMGLLGLDHVGLHDHFFDLGGHSFLLIELTGRLQEEIDPDVAVLTVVENPTVATLAAALSRRAEPSPAPSRPDDPEDRARLRRQAQAGARRRGRPADE